MLALPLPLMPSAHVALPRGVCILRVPVLRTRLPITALAADATPDSLVQLCAPVQQAIADLQAAQLLVLCWCILASQLIVYAFDKRDGKP